MRKIVLPAVIVVLLAVVAGWLLLHRQGDDFDYEAAFERPSADSAAAPAALLDIATIAGKNREAVREVLGEPQRREPAEFSERCRYGRAEITYIAGKADWITVPMGYGSYPLTADALAALGLPVRDPDEVNEHENVWHTLAGYREVRLVGGDQGAIYARIKVATL